jgi:hypothetical protein
MPLHWFLPSHVLDATGGSNGAPLMDLIDARVGVLRPLRRFPNQFDGQRIAGAPCVLLREEHRPGNSSCAPWPLPAAASSPLRSAMADSARLLNATTSTTLHRVAPGWTFRSRASDTAFRGSRGQEPTESMSKRCPRNERETHVLVVVMRALRRSPLPWTESTLLPGAPRLPPRVLLRLRYRQTKLAPGRPQ